MDTSAITDSVTELVRYPPDAVFHGHAHRGSLEGQTVNGVPVYNVAKPLLQRAAPGRPPFRLFENPRFRSSFVKTDP